MNGRVDDRLFSSSASRALAIAITATPLLSETVADALDGVAVVARFPSDLAGLGGLVEHVRPDALIVDGDDTAEQLAGVAIELSIPLVQITLVSQQLRVLRNGSWTGFSPYGTSQYALRNTLIGAMYSASHLPRKHLREPVPQ
jgi:hypothetical protein